MLEVQGLSGGWGPTVIVEDLGLTIGRGETVAVIGRNGVGKTTSLELLMGRARLRSGRIILEGRDLTTLPTHQRARAGFGYVPQGREIFPSLTVREHLRISASLGEWNEARVLALLPRLGERLDSYGTQLSGGEQQMLALARALLGNPRVLLLDEPFEGLAPIVVEYLVGAVREISANSSLAILLVEQRIDIALRLSQRCLIMDRGRCVFEGPSEDIGSDDRSLAALMGLEL